MADFPDVQDDVLDTETLLSESLLIDQPGHTAQAKSSQAAPAASDGFDLVDVSHLQSPTPASSAASASQADAAAYTEVTSSQADTQTTQTDVIPLRDSIHKGSFRTIVNPRTGVTRTIVPFGIRSKLLVFIAVLTLSFVAISFFVTSASIDSNLSGEVISKGETIASTLAASAVDVIVAHDSAIVQAVIDQFADVDGVGYILAQDASGAIYAHTFSPFVPQEIIDASPSMDELASSDETLVRELEFSNEVKRGAFYDIAAPVLAGNLGTIRVGMDQAAITAAANRAGFQLATFCIIAGIVAIISGIFFAQRLVEPVDRLVELSDRVGRGDLTQLASITTKDELGFLGRSFNDTILQLRGLVQTQEERDVERQEREALQTNVSEFLNVAMDIADGDLTKRGRVTEDVLGNVVDAINLVIEEISYLLMDVQRAAGSVNQGASGMIQITEDIAESSEQQTSEASNVSRSVNEVTSSIRRMADNAEASAQAARQALQASQQGQDAVNNTLTGMQGIRREVQSIAKRVKTLGDRSLEISEIVETISHISSQTNLLALNAAIEAAGAGEAGGRFAIVADEVRKLAEDSAMATQRIAGLIKNVQSEVQEVVIMVEAGTNQVETGYRVANEAGERLREISEIAKQSSQLAQVISQATQEQVDRVESVDTAVQSIKSISDGSQNKVRQGREASEELLRLSQQLTESLSRFRLA
ncbi:MAG: methyl-accepting chemotaxis protein [Deinococcota bacterium]